MAVSIRQFALTKFIKRNNIASPKIIAKISKLLDTLNLSASALFIKDKQIYAFDGLSTWSLDQEIDMFVEPPRRNFLEDQRQLEFFKKQAHKQWLRKWYHDDPAVFEKRVSVEKKRIANVRKRVIVK